MAKPIGLDLLKLRKDVDYKNAESASQHRKIVERKLQ